MGMRVQWMFLIVPVVWLTSCGSFQGAWRNALSTPPPDALQGPWEGEWRSEVNGHRGKLRCVIRAEPGEAGEEAGDEGNEAAFHYWARWAVFSGDFRGRYPVERLGEGHWRFQGSSDLGWLGGVYTHRGEVRDGEFRAVYEGSHDRGTMLMRRPASLRSSAEVDARGRPDRAAQSSRSPASWATR